MADAKIKSLKIKTGVAKRLAKEVEYYVKEVETEKNRRAKHEADGKDEYTLKKQDEVIRDSEQMIPDTLRRLATAADDLKTCMADAEAECAEKAEYTGAKDVLVAADECLTKHGVKTQQTA